MSEALKPCPHCGSPASLQYECASDIYDLWKVECEKCTASIYDESQHLVVKMWNLRAPIEVTDALVDVALTAILNDDMGIRIEEKTVRVALEAAMKEAV